MPISLSWAHTVFYTEIITKKTVKHKKQFKDISSKAHGK